jgi:hypothetical protein
MLHTQNFSRPIPNFSADYLKMLIRMDERTERGLGPDKRLQAKIAKLGSDQLSAIGESHFNAQMNHIGGMRQIARNTRAGFPSVQIQRTQPGEI